VFVFGIVSPMTDSTTDEPGDSVSALSDRAFHRACAIYDQLAEAVTLTIRRLTDRQGSADALSKEEVALLRAHQRVLVMVLDFESEILKRARAQSREPDAPLDLDAARAELARRLDRIAAVRKP
jgi:uncharacterized membrane protein YdfJ with MMPL/SSD domain